jgi:hypothetical protein
MPTFSPTELAKRTGVRALMVTEAEGTYFADRERTARSMSREAADERAAAAHAELAERYEALATVFGAKRPTEFPPDYL